MEVDAFLADSAEAVQGKIYALGIGWNSIFAAAFPTQHPRLSIGLTIRVPYTATNQMHRLTVHLETSDGERLRIGQEVGGPDHGPVPVYELGGEFNVGRPALLPAGDEQVVPIALTIDGLQFDRPDMFSWVISIDGSPVKRLPMRVQQLARVGPMLS